MIRLFFLCEFIANHIVNDNVKIYSGLTWGDAETACNNYNGHLASFSHRSELEWALDWYNESESLWIGLNNNGQGINLV